MRNSRAHGSGEANKRDIVVGISYNPINQEGKTEPSLNNSGVIQDRLEKLLSSVTGKICQLEKPLSSITRSSLTRC